LQLGSVSQQYLVSFPDYLFVIVGLDAITESGLPKKMNIDISFDVNHFDVSRFRTTGDSSIAAPGPLPITENMLNVMGMGFTEDEARKTLSENEDNVGLAVELLFKHFFKNFLIESDDRHPM
jgi:hypothetical protein